MYDPYAGFLMAKYRIRPGTKNRLLTIFLALAALAGIVVFFIFVSLPRLQDAVEGYRSGVVQPEHEEYESSRMRIVYDEVFRDGGNYYTADIYLKDMNCIKTSFCGGGYAPYRIGDPVSTAEEKGAVLAVNGDNCCYDTEGLVIRDSHFIDLKKTGGDILLVYHDGTIDIINGSVISDEDDADRLVREGVMCSFSCGQALLVDGYPVERDDTWHIKEAYTCIGTAEDGHFFIIVSNSNSSHSMGMTKSDMADILIKKGVRNAYIIESGTECVFIFGGEVKNNLCGRSVVREISDIIYFAD